MFRVGQKVVCVDVCQDSVATSMVYLRKGAVYEVEAVLGEDSLGRTGIVVVGCYSEHPLHAWKHTRFRSLVDTRQEISFTTGADPSSSRFDNRHKERI
jgi:hypothetical protein